MSSAVTHAEPDFRVGDNFCAYMGGFDASRFLADVNTPPTRNTVEADTSRNKGVRTLTSKQALAFTATGFRDYTDPSGFTPFLDAVFQSGDLTQFMYFPATDEPAGVYGWAGQFFFTENDGPAAVGAANAMSIAATSPRERALVRSLQPQREFADADLPIAGTIIDEPSGATNFGGAGFLQIMELEITGAATDISIEIAHSLDAFAADDNQLIDLGTYGTTGGNTGRQEFFDELGDDATIQKDTRVKVAKTGVGTLDKLVLVVGFFRALRLVKP